MSTLAAATPLSEIYTPGSDLGGDVTIASFVSPIIQNVILVVAVLCFFVIVLAGFRYVSSAGNEKEISNASNTLTYALIGLGLAAAAYVVTRVLFGIGGFGGIF